MGQRYRSRRARLAALSAQLRAEGQSWAAIARTIADREHVNARVALRLAHGWTQEQVATRWNEQWPPKGGSAGITDKNISYWETWPQSGAEPSLKTLRRLAQLYQWARFILILAGQGGLAWQWFGVSGLVKRCPGG